MPSVTLDSKYLNACSMRANWKATPYTDSDGQTNAGLSIYCLGQQVDAVLSASYTLFADQSWYFKLYKAIDDDTWQKAGSAEISPVLANARQDIRFLINYPLSSVPAYYEITSQMAAAHPWQYTDPISRVLTLTLGITGNVDTYTINLTTGCDVRTALKTAFATDDKWDFTTTYYNSKLMIIIFDKAGRGLTTANKLAISYSYNPVYSEGQQDPSLTFTTTEDEIQAQVVSTVRVNDLQCNRWLIEGRAKAGTDLEVDGKYQVFCRSTAREVMQASPTTKYKLYSWSNPTGSIWYTSGSARMSPRELGTLQAAGEGGAISVVTKEFFTLGAIH